MRVNVLHTSQPHFGIRLRKGIVNWMLKVSFWKWTAYATVKRNVSRKTYTIEEFKEFLQQKKNLNLSKIENAQKQIDTYN